MPVTAFGKVCYIEREILSQGVVVLSVLRSHRNRPCLRVLMFVLLVSWVAMLVTAICPMPGGLQVFSSNILTTGCAEPAKHTPDHNSHQSPLAQDCSATACLDSPPAPAFAFKFEKPDTPLAVFCLAWLFGYWLRHVPLLLVPRTAAPPAGRRILLIYRFHTLLN